MPDFGHAFLGIVQYPVPLSRRRLLLHSAGVCTPVRPAVSIKRWVLAPVRQLRVLAPVRFHPVPEGLNVRLDRSNGFKAVQASKQACPPTHLATGRSVVIWLAFIHPITARAAAPLPSTPPPLRRSPAAAPPARHAPVATARARVRTSPCARAARDVCPPQRLRATRHAAWGVGLCR